MAGRYLRNRNEYEYLKYVGGILPDCVPKVFAAGDGGFTMEYLGAGFANWKQLLLEGRCRPKDARQAGKTLGAIHRVSFGDAALARLFDTTKNFHQLRTDPYLVTTGQRHPELREYFERENRRLENTHANAWCTAITARRIFSSAMADRFCWIVK